MGNFDVWTLVSEVKLVVALIIVLTLLIIYLLIVECVRLFRVVRQTRKLNMESYTINFVQNVSSRQIKQHWAPHSAKLGIYPNQISKQREDVCVVQNECIQPNVKALAVLKPEDNIAFFLDRHGVPRMEDDRSIKIVTLHQNANGSDSSPTISARELFSVKPVLTKNGTNSDVVSLSMTIPVMSQPMKFMNDAVKIIDEIETATSGSTSDTISIATDNKKQMTTWSSGNTETSSSGNVSEKDTTKSSSESNQQQSAANFFEDVVTSLTISAPIEKPTPSPVSNVNDRVRAGADFSSLELKSATLSDMLMRPRPLWERYKKLSMNSCML